MLHPNGMDIVLSEISIDGLVTLTGSRREARRLGSRHATAPLSPPSLSQRDHPARDLALSPLHPELPRRRGAARLARAPSTSPIQSRSGSPMVRRRCSSVRLDQPLPPSNPTLVAVTKPPTVLRHPAMSDLRLSRRRRGVQGISLVADHGLALGRLLPCLFDH